MCISIDHIQILADGNECLKNSQIFGVSRLEVNGNNSLDGSVIFSGPTSIGNHNSFVIIVDGVCLCMHDRYL